MKQPQRYISRLLLYAVTALMLLVSIGSAQDISIAVSLDRDTIGMDEQAVLTVEVSGTIQNLPEPNIPKMSMFEMYSQGRSTSISVVNGQMAATATYRYLLVPKRAGTYPIDQIAIVYNNRRYKGNGVNVTVLQQGSTAPPSVESNARDDSGDSRDYFLLAEVDKKKPYVNQQVTLTLKFYTAVQYYGSPELVEPTTTGFWTEILGNRAAYTQVINNRKYKVIERKYALFPTQTGDLTIGRATIRATVAARNRRRDPFDVFGDFFGRGEEITVRSKPVQVKVQPLPSQGRPSDFTGTIGNFSITAKADKREVEVNQPVTVTFKITGQGNIKSVAEPDIPENDDFRVYRASSNENVTRLNDKIGGSKLFEEVFIPKHPGEMVIPTISFSFFDPVAEKYKHITTKPISVKVIKPEGYVASPDVPYAQPELTIGSNARDIRYIKEDMGDTKPVGSLIISSPLYLIINALPVLALATLLAVRIRKEKLAGDIGLARSRAASKMARKRLARAHSLANTENVEEFFAEIQRALFSYIADKLNISPHGLTVDKIRELLQQRSANEELIAQIGEIMRKCDFARFAPSSMKEADIESALKEAEDVMVNLEGVRFDA